MVNLNQSEVRRNEPGVNQAKSDGIRAHAKRSPLLRERLGKPDDGSFCGGVVGLADVPV